MSLVKRNTGFPGSLPSLLDDFFGRDFFDWGLSNFSKTDTTLPAVNIKETADAYEVEMAAPGMEKKDFKIQLDGQVLSISSEKTVENEQKDGEKYTRREFSYQSFQRSFNLPKEVVDEEKIEARYNNGVLHLLIPKKEEARPKPARMIEVA
jgi:HSP20 family protein